MPAKTFAEKILGAKAGSVVFRKPDLLLTHDNTASIRKTFEKMGGTKVADPDQLILVLDHNAPPTNAKLATDYQLIRNTAKEQGIKKFFDAGRGICHEIVSWHAKPGMIIVGSDSHTCTAGACNALAAGIDRTEAAGIWKKGETWFLVPESIKITLTGKLKEGVYAKDLSLWIIGMIGSEGANYMSIEYHGGGIKSLSMADRLTIANLASEMGAKNAVFPADEILAAYLGTDNVKGIWADPDARYAKEFSINLDDIFPVVAAPHSVENIKSVSSVKGIVVHEGLIGTCTNGRIQDLRVAAAILQGKTIADGFQLNIIPASREIFLQAVEEDLISIFLKAGANVLSSSCGACLGSGQGIPADGSNVISTANRNFLGRMGNPKASIYLASPATVACSALMGEITDPRSIKVFDEFPFEIKENQTLQIPENELRRLNAVWNYTDIHNLNTDQMFAGNLTYNILSSDPAAIVPHLFKGFDEAFVENVKEGDIIITGDNFGCGSSREHPAVGLAEAGIKAIIVRSVNRIFYRSCINQGLLVIVNKDIVDHYKAGDKVEIDELNGIIYINNKPFHFEPLPEKLMDIIKQKGLVNYMKGS
jgi:3-isopropylmalate/(R)-2-methylmalate dehydratase large subunit